MPVKNKARFTNSGLEGKITSLDEDEKEVIKNSGIPINITVNDISNLIEGSDDVVVDINETDDKLIVKLDEHFKDNLADKSQLLDNATLELKENTDGDVTINLVSEFGDKTKVNSPVAFKKEDFEIQNNYISLKSSGSFSNTLYIHNIEIQSSTNDANLVILNTLNYTADTAEILATMLNKQDHYSALLTGTIIDTNQSISFQLNDFEATESLASVALYYIDATNQKSEFIVDHTAQVTDTIKQLL